MEGKQVASQDQDLKRGIAEWQVAFIGLGGVIGSCYFLGVGWDIEVMGPGVFGAFDYRPFNFTLVLNVLGAFAVFLVIFLTGIRRRTRYITKLRDEIEILGGGDLDYEVSVKGNDELTDLADNLNQMRQALKHHMEEEARLTEERQTIVTRLSHDIRTPLTSMNLFIDLLKQGKYEDEAQREHYLDRIQESAENLTGLTEELFQAARSPLQVMPQQTEEAGAKAGNAEVIKILSDAAEALRLSGFMIEESYEVRDPSELMVAMDRPDFARVMDNITSNILRYADPTEEIRFACRSREDGTVLTFTNRTCPPEMEETGGSGIGLTNVRRLMQKAGGSMKAGVDGENFVVELVFHTYSARDGEEVKNAVEAPSPAQLTDPRCS